MSSASKGNGEETELRLLLRLISVCPSKQQLPSLTDSHDHRAVNPNTLTTSSNSQNSEARALEAFSKRYEEVRNFLSHDQAGLLEEIFTSLVKHRLLNRDWSQRAPADNLQRVMTVLRMLMRDHSLQKAFIYKLAALQTLCEELERHTDLYYKEVGDSSTSRILIEMTNIIQKLCRSDDYRTAIVKCSAHNSLVKLLWSQDTTLLHCTLYALCDLCQSNTARSHVCQLNPIEKIIHILEEYDIDSKRHAAKLLKILCAETAIRESVKVYDGIPILLSLLQGRDPSDLKLLRSVVWSIQQLAADSDTSDELRRAGVIPFLISHLQDRKYSSSVDVTAPASATFSANRTNPLSSYSSINEDLVTTTTGTGKGNAATLTEEMLEQVCLMKVACCAALTELVKNDHNCHQIIANNGVYALGMLILPLSDSGVSCKASENLQRSALRTLRFLFSVEGNRRKFKRIFQDSQSVFTAFIDVGHYVHNIDKYQTVVDVLNALPEDELSSLRTNLETANQQRSIVQYIEDYAVIEQLGSGAFGSVAKVKKRNSGQTYYALKEVNMSVIGRSAKEWQKSAGEIISEIDIVKDQMKHPNIVKYYRTFTLESKLYIVMELIDGAPIAEHFNSLKEKGGRFSESRIWNVFIQIVLALRYLHKEKHIVHRDLSPNNIMLGESDHVTITDFGLAKHKAGDKSDMKSKVGTIHYWCPELVQDLPYGEKADVWAIGCILYQMCALTMPFYTSNLMALARKIVAGEYNPLPDNSYSQKISNTIDRCLTVSSDERPDITGVAAFIADELILHTEKVRHTNQILERKLEKEKRQTQKHHWRAANYMQNCQKLFIASQEQPDKLGSSYLSLTSQINAGVGHGRGGGMVNGSEGSSGASGNMDQNNNGVIEADYEDEEEELPSSSDSNNSAESLRLAFRRPPKPPSANTRRKLDFNNNLEVMIPAVNSRHGSRDSSSAGEPSPNHEHSKPSSGVFHRSFSSPVMETKQKRQKSSGKARPGSTSGAQTLSISPRKVRLIHDPIQQILHVLHKVIYITQLPPSLSHNPGRTVIDKFKRSLFSTSANALNLKAELKKLASGSPDLIDINWGNMDMAASKSVTVSPSKTLSSSNGSISHENGLEMDISHGVSYEQLLSIIEMVLLENNYYGMPKSVSNGANYHTLPAMSKRSH